MSTLLSPASSRRPRTILPHPSPIPPTVEVYDPVDIEEEDDDEGDGDDAAYVPPEGTLRVTQPVTTETTSGRGKRSATAKPSKSAREAARKSNHSRIEKLRREKINDALTALKQLVDTGPAKKPTTTKRSEEKEFKLDILERTVTYLTDLKQRVEVLEGGAPSGSNDETGAAETGAGHTEPTVHKVCRGTQTISPNIDDNALPPISSILGSANFRETETAGSPNRKSFPFSPPPSGKTIARSTPNIPPLLELGEPRYSKSPPLGSSSWTRDDESAASLLIQFSSERQATSKAVGKKPTTETPSSILGIRGGSEVAGDSGAEVLHSDLKKRRFT